MYLSYYGLARSPFEIGPEPDPFFETSAHLDALWGLIYGITENRGFISITGGPGVGKTTTLYAAVQSLGLTHPSLQWIEFNDPKATPEAVLLTIVDKLNLPQALTPGGDLGPIRNRLLRLRDSGKSLVLVFDAAQDFCPELLNFLERLAALNGDEAPLFLMVFVGFPAWDELLRRPEHRELDRRVAVRVSIPALTARLARDYIDFRIAAAGGVLSEVIDAGAVRALIAASKGNPGQIHALAGRALDLGRANRHQPVTASDIRAARRQIDPQPQKYGQFGDHRVMALAFIVFLAGSLTAFWLARHPVALIAAQKSKAVTPLPGKPATPSKATTP